MADHFPEASVLDDLFRVNVVTEEQVTDAKGELNDRLKAQYEIHRDFSAAEWALYRKIRKLALTDELKARSKIAAQRMALDLAEEAIDREGHVGDIDKMAREKAA